MSTKTVSLAEARANFSKIGKSIVETGEPVTVFRHSKPYLTIMPAISEPTAETLEAVEGARKAISDPDFPVFEDFDSMMSALEEAADV